MNRFLVELDRDKKTTSGRGREAKLLNRRAGVKIQAQPVKNTA
jgi:hypothetical protein